MSLNQFYHEQGVAQMRAQNSDRGFSSDQKNRGSTRIADRTTIKPLGHHEILPSVADRFEVFRADEVQVTSTQFAGGDWRWRLADRFGETLVQGSGYPSRRTCLDAVSLLRDRAHAARLRR